MKNRVSTHQLKHLLENISTVTGESPLIEMYKSMLRDALLDLRDEIAGNAKLEWYVARQDAGLKSLQKKVLDYHAAKTITAEVVRDLCYTLDFANEHPYDKIREDAIAPLTFKEV